MHNWTSDRKSKNLKKWKISLQTSFLDHNQSLSSVLSHTSSILCLLLFSFAWLTSQNRQRTCVEGWGAHIATYWVSIALWKHEQKIHVQYCSTWVITRVDLWNYRYDTDRRRNCTQSLTHQVCTAFLADMTCEKHSFFSFFVECFASFLSGSFSYCK